VDFDLKQQGILHIYRDKAGFDHAGEVSKLLAEGGLPRRAVTPDEMRAIEPTLAGQLLRRLLHRERQHRRHPQVHHGLSLACERLGVRACTGRTVSACSSNGQTAQRHAVQRRVSQVDARGAGGVRRRAQPRLRAAGRPAQHLPGQGLLHHRDLNDAQSQAAAPTVSLLDDETKLVTSRLGADRFRVAGTAEFNGYNKRHPRRPHPPAGDWVNQCFPGVNTRRVEPWAGLRPMMPNMLPRVGPGRQPNVFYNTGHGHLGWTLSAWWPTLRPGCF
jgi:D-amino-acid dehydrogenase